MNQDLEAFKAEATRVASALIDSPLLQSLPHNLAMEGLLLAFGAMASHHTCCTANAARASALVTARLCAEAEGVPAGSHIH